MMFFDVFCRSVMVRRCTRGDPPRKVAPHLAVVFRQRQQNLRRHTALRIGDASELHTCGRSRLWEGSAYDPLRCFQTFQAAKSTFEMGSSIGKSPIFFFYIGEGLLIPQ
jgi:hypothetical protein